MENEETPLSAMTEALEDLAPEPLEEIETPHGAGFLEARRHLIKSIPVFDMRSMVDIGNGVHHDEPVNIIELGFIPGTDFYSLSSITLNCADGSRKTASIV